MSENTLHITRLEANLLNAFSESETMFVEVLRDYADEIEKNQFSGVVASLIKKGLAEHISWDKKDDAMELTPVGRRLTGWDSDCGVMTNTLPGDYRLIDGEWILEGTEPEDKDEKDTDDEEPTEAEKAIAHFKRMIIEELKTGRFYATPDPMVDGVWLVFRVAPGEEAPVMAFLVYLVDDDFEDVVVDHKLVNSYAPEEMKTFLRENDINIY